MIMIMKKKIFLAACAWLLCLGHAMADDQLIINNVTIPKGGIAELSVGFSFTSTTDKVGFSYTITLPEGISFVKDGEGDPMYVKDATSLSKMNITVAGGNNFAATPRNETATIEGTDGTLLTLMLEADASLDVGNSFTVYVTNAKFQQHVGGTTSDIDLADFTFTATIGEEENYVTLNENSPIAPTQTAEGLVKVKRTITAGQWNTICLPIALTPTDLTSIFGTGYELAEWTGYTTEKDGDDVTSISVEFSNVTGNLKRNTPYIIKSVNNVSEFTVTKEIRPNNTPEKEVDDDDDNFIGVFKGTYVANTIVPENSLFLNGDKFWYSTGATKMKAYRAYFTFKDVLASVASSGARVMMNISDGNGNTTRIVDTRIEPAMSERVYSVSGQYMGESDQMDQLPKGVYIVKGKKVIMK